MNKSIAIKIYKSIEDHIKQEHDLFPGKVSVKGTLPPGNVSDFHPWVNGKPFEGGFLIQGSNDFSVWVLLIKWHEDRDYYIVLYPEDRQGPIAEIREVIDNGGDAVLKWNYKPTKQDGENEKRKEYFKRYFLSLEVLVSIPSEVSDVPDFLEELLLLAENRLKADSLDKNIPDYRSGFPEGRSKEKLHKFRERSSALIRSVKNEFFEKHGKLFCQCCGFSFEDIYGDIGSDFIEAHHIRPLSDLDEGGGETNKEDIVLVCSNCHRMLHRKRPWVGLEELKSILKKK